MDREAVRKLIREHRQRAQTAYDNYQDTGNGRYYNTYTKHDEMASALEGYLNAESYIRSAKRLGAMVRSWAATVSELPHYTPERKEAAILDILNGIQVEAIHADAERAGQNQVY